MKILLYTFFLIYSCAEGFSEKSKIMILYASDLGIKPYCDWNDGFTEAVKILSKNYHFDWFNLKKDKKLPEGSRYDACFAKGKYRGLAMNYLLEKIPRTIPRLYFITSSIPIPESDVTLNQFNILFYETKWFKQKYLKHFSNTIRAFGINSKIFNQVGIPQTRDIDYLLSSNLLYYKKSRRIEKFCKLPGKKLAILTGVQNHRSCIQLFKKSGITILDRMPRSELKKYYQRSKYVYIPHTIEAGGDRTLLEARACLAKVLVEKDNIKLCELLKGPILNEMDYANQIYKGLKAVGLSIKND